jgi:cytochrome c
MSRSGTMLCSAALLVALVSSAASAQGDPEKGRKLFNRCKACHVVEEEKNKIGPYLFGVLGREAGSVPDLEYSDAMENSGVVWSDETIAAYLKDPKGYIAGNRMAFPGLKKDEEIADLLAYLHEEAGMQ